MKRVISASLSILLWLSVTEVSSGQESVESLGLQGIPVTSLSLNYGILAVGTDGHGVYWQSEYLPTDTGWKHIRLDSQAVQTVYAHKSGPIGWAISAGIAPDTTDSAFVYCSFLGGDFGSKSAGILDSLTERVSELDGFPDPTICGETFAAGGKALYRRGFLDTSWVPVYTTSHEGNIQAVKVREEYPGVVLAGGAEGFTGFLLIRSTDFGNRWVHISPPGTVADMDFGGDSTDLIVAATYQGVHRSTNGGRSWQSVLNGGGTYLLTEVARDILTANIYAAGGDALGGAVLFVTSDNGERWRRIDLQMSGPIVDLETDRSGWVYFATAHDGVFRMESKVTGVGENNEASPPTALLLQNFPNPFNSTTTIRYNIPKAASVRLTVCNTLGQELTDLANYHHPPGIYTATWSAADTGTGIYFCVLRTSSGTQVRRMLLLR